MDVKALYPSCRVARTTKLIIESFRKADLEFTEVNIPFLLKFVSVITKGVTGNPELDAYLQVPKARTTLNSWLKRKSEAQFQGPPLEDWRGIDKATLKHLLGIACAKSVEVVMTNHYFTIDKRIFRQKDGSPIGLDMSVEVASLYMSLWDKSFRDKLRKLGIKVDVYTQYIDDILIVTRAINPGWDFCLKRKTMIFDPDKANTQLNPDQYTFEILLKIANTLDSDIQLTMDVPSQNEGGKMPVLDLNVWVSQNVVRHSFYSKPMASPLAIMYKSALSAKSKCVSLLQEGLRRLRNLDSLATDMEKQEILSQFMAKLLWSGYDHKFRHQLLEGILKRANEIEKEISDGDRVRYRSRGQILSQKKQSIGKHTSTWFLRGDVQNTFKVQATPNSRLKECLMKSQRSKIGAEGGATNFIELGGKPVSSGLSNTELFTGQQGCFYPKKCMVNGKKNCRIS